MGTGCKNSVASFFNLGKDALLVCPCPIGEDVHIYSSLGPFISAGSRDQIRAFWSRVGKEALDHIRARGGKPTWMSTSGLGVYWLHLRLDSRPKYYTHQPYRNG